MVDHVQALREVESLITPAPNLPMRVSLHSAHDLLAKHPPVEAPPSLSGLAASARPGAWYALALRAFALRTADLDGELIAPALLAGRIEPHAYQLRVVREVLRVKKPAAILADEVGLGKTIEAGLILKELLLRGMARSALVVAPKALLAQWQDALRDRFEEDFVLAEEKRFRGYDAEDRVICSYGQLVSAFEQVAARPWDCLIADEAHLLANPDARRRRCVAEVRASWRLLLTATPIQNHVTDLYSLIDLAVPGRLGTLRQFTEAYVADAPACREVLPARSAELRAIAQETMCRTRRSETDIAFVPRRVDTLLVPPAAPEAALNHEVTTYLRALYRRATEAEPPPRPAKARARPERDVGQGRAASAGAQQPNLHLNRGALIREIVALQQSLSSSPQAIAAALRARAERHPDERGQLADLAERCDAVTGAKETLLLEALTQLAKEPVLIFTLRLETARRLREVIARSRRSVECYTGALAAQERRALVERFNAGQLRTLIATDAGAEGLNLHERCHIVFNYDLHWNPMKMEQRIGRVHRLGQRREVRVANFALRGSIDEYVLILLRDKLDLFHSTIGELDSVLADLHDGELDLEQRLLDLWLRGADEAELERAAKDLDESIKQARKQLNAATSLTVEVLG